MQTISAEAKFVLQFINQTQQSVFLTGKAGTGKTTLLREIIQTTHKNTVVVAPTGIAALNAGGVTIHSMFQIPFGGFIPELSSSHFDQFSKFETKTTLRRNFKISELKKTVIKNMDLLIIDEVSMLRPDLLDAIDCVLQSVRKKPQPFGGVQALFIGDLLQLPPVIKDDEWRVLKNYYLGKFFFHSHFVQQNPPLYVELSKIFRQSDEKFISVLNNLRNNRITANDMIVLNEFVKPNFDLKANKGYITLTTHNAKADNMNMQALRELDGELFSYQATIVDDFPEKIFPVEQHLQLKVGAQIMFIKNDLSPEKRFFNGKMGLIKSLSKEEILVYFSDDNKTIEVERYEWENIRYKINDNTKEIEDEILGTFSHYPIKLAWAITIHKSQGLTFDKAALDVSQVFMPGQAYVALSRLRSLEGLVLLSPIQMNGIENDESVMNYAENKASEEVLEKSLANETRKFIHNFLKNSFNWNDLAQEWRSHYYSYKDKGNGTTKSRHSEWAENQFYKMENLMEPSRKFILQIDKLFAQENTDLQFINQRIHAAFNYFLKPFDELVYEVLWKIEEVKRTKKAKQFHDELILLEDLQTKAVLRLMKAKLLIEAVVKNETITKETLTSNEIKYYKINILDKIKEEFKTINISLLKDDDLDENRYNKKEKTKTGDKKSTFEETFDLWKQNKTIEEIAQIRRLTPQTISGHFAKLIENDKVKLEEVLSQERISALATIFVDFTGDSVGGLKEQYGDNFSWDELKIYKASLRINSNKT